VAARVVSDEIMRSLTGNCCACGSGYLMVVVPRDGAVARDGYIVCVNPTCSDVQATQRLISGSQVTAP